MADTIFSKLFSEKSSLGKNRRPKEKVQDFLTKVTETVPFMDPLYYSPQESFNDFMRDKQAPTNVAPEFLPSDSKYLENTPGTQMSNMWIKDEGLIDLWEKAGKPRIQDTGDSFSRGLYTDPELKMYKQQKDGQWKHRKEINPLSHMIGKVKRALATPTVYAGSKGTLVSELAHAVEHRNPEILSYHTSKEEMTAAVRHERQNMKWSSETEMYNTPGTVEHHTHKVTEPKLIDYLIKNYKHPLEGNEVYEMDWKNYGRKYEN